MSQLQKTLLMNAAIAVGLLFELAKGAPVRGLLVAALVLFVVANLALWLTGRSSKRTTNA